STATVSSKRTTSPRTVNPAPRESVGSLLARVLTSGTSVTFALEEISAWVVILKLRDCSVQAPAFSQEHGGSSCECQNHGRGERSPVVLDSRPSNQAVNHNGKRGPIGPGQERRSTELTDSDGESKSHRESECPRSQREVERGQNAPRWCS